MLKSFSGKIRELLAKRVGEAEEEVLLTDKHFQKLNTLINETLEEISQSLPPEKMRLIAEVDHYWVERDELAYGRLYRQGLLDGLAADRLLRMARRACREW